MREAARRYGVVIKEDSTVDAGATQALRKKMAGERGPTKLFDRGFDSIEELKSRCERETGLAAPAQPQFTKWSARSASQSTPKPKPARRAGAAAAPSAQRHSRKAARK